MKHFPARLLPLFGALAAVVAGCVNAPTPDRADRPWTANAASSADSGSWDDLRQRRPDLSRPLALAELLDLALQNSSATRKAWHDARAATAQVDKAQGLFMPSLTATASGGRSGVLAASPSSFDLRTAQYGPGLQLNYLVINFGGGRGAAVEQALQSVAMANQLFNRAIQDALLGVETAYFDCISAQAGLEAALASVADARKALEAAQARNAAGMATSLDVLQAQAAYDQSLYNQAAAQGQLQVARGALAVAAGFPADLPLVPAAPGSELPPTLATNNLCRLIDDAIASRPDIAALRADLAAKRAAVDVAHAASWPNLYLNAGINRDYTETFRGSAQHADRDWSYNAGASLQWTIFDGWQTESEIRTAEEQALAAQETLAQAELAASADVWTRFQNYATALQKYAFSTAYAQSAAAARDLAAESYSAGLKTVLDLLTADAQLAAARSQLVATRQEVFTTLANLAYATGRLDIRAANPFADAAQKEHKP